MKHYLKIVAIALLGISIGCQNSQHENEMIDYLKTNWKSPENYVLEKFDSHDYVFIGEYHRIKHDVDLILNLIPKMYENGIYNLAIEFGDYQEQPLVDSLLLLPRFDRELAKEIIFKCYPVWGYKEYIDIYQVAWEVNHSDILKNKKKFRVVNIGPKFDPCKEGGAWKNLDPDVFMANVILNEIVSKNEKALIYSGNHHAFTKYHQPLYDFKKDTLEGFKTTRLGNVVYDSLKERTFNIYLHAAWISDKGWDEPSVLPVNGDINSIMNLFENKPVGFDVINSPFGKLTCNNSYYAFGYPDFTLDQYCDGYIYQNEFKNYQPITMEENFINANNIGELKDFLICLDVEQGYINSINTESANEILFEDIRKHFDHLMK